MDTPGSKHAGCCSRRTALQVGCSSALGLTLPKLLQDVAHGESRPIKQAKSKSVLMVYLPGAPSHIDTFDLKPDAPPEIRGEFNPIATKTPGVQICEHLPKLAQLTDKYAIVRTMAIKSLHNGAHEQATPLMLGGIDDRPPGTGMVNSRQDWPSYSAGLEYLRPSQGVIPNAVHLPHFISNGALGYAGQNGGLLGPKYDPWQIKGDPNNAKFNVDTVRLPAGLSIDRLSLRKDLLADFNAERTHLAQLAQRTQYTTQQQKAFRMLTSGRLAKAFDLSQESDALRDRFGRHTWGQSLLLARRLIEAGVPYVQANLGQAGFWDTHQDNFNAHKTRLLPPFDIAFSALLEDMHVSGLIDETFVVVTSEFGRTPKIGGFVGTPDYSPTGRDHWLPCFCSLFAGGGVQPGQVIGASDKNAAYPTTQAFYPSDFGATVYSALGVDPRSEVHDMFGRPLRLNAGNVMSPLFG